MVFTLIFILLAGLLIKSFYTHYISEKRKYFSFDDRRFTDDDYLKVQDLNIGSIERVFLYVMLALYILALGVHLFINPVWAVWIAALFVSTMLTLSIVVDLKLYTVSYDKSHLVMVAIWAIVIIALFVFLFIRSINDVNLAFEDDGVNLTGQDYMIAYEDINSVEMTDELPDIPFNHIVLGVGGHLHGSFVKEGEAFSIMAVEDQSQEMIRIDTAQGPVYVNDKDPQTTASWFDDLQAATAE
ncbi:hypothetical protein [Salinicoccus albus]|uniref:hypothetical protein n=1 Tax=Salinicoccus albus TaxID=418756 RepID=UPI0003630A3C|nr:hypothetical protein [Salinicoccus albus]